MVEEGAAKNSSFYSRIPYTITRVMKRNVRRRSFEQVPRLLPQRAKAGFYSPVTQRLAPDSNEDKPSDTHSQTSTRRAPGDAGC